MDAFISYEGLPLSAGGAHSLGKKPCGILHAQCLDFLRTYTDNDVAEHITLTFHGSRDRTYKSLPSVWNLSRRFGFPSLGSWPYDNGSRRTYSWHLRTVKDVENAMQWLDKLEGFPPNQPSPLVLSFMWRFYFVDPATKAVLPGQDKIPNVDPRVQNSQLYLRLGQKSTISVWFAFPFEAWTEDSSRYIWKVMGGLPFKCSDKHWRLWEHSKNSNWVPQVLHVK